MVSYVKSKPNTVVYRLVLSLEDQNEVYKFFKWRRPAMEDDLKKYKMEYLR
jgi:hypothetical protein